MSHKYLIDIGIEDENMPQNWYHDDSRQGEWEKQREIYGFDERETWNLSYSFKLWFYERLKMYNELNSIDKNLHKFNYADKEMTMQQCINFILEVFEKELKRKEPNWDVEDLDEAAKNIKKAYQLMIQIMPCLWW